MASFQRPKTAHEAVLEEIRQRLLDGRLPPGAAVRPDAIGDELGFSAVPIREALRILEGEGQVRYRPHYGYQVIELDIDDLVEIYRIRELLETEAIEVAIPKLQPDDLDRMSDTMREMERVEDDIVQLTEANRRFHFTLLEAAGMPHLLRLIRVLWDSSDPYRSRYFMRPENRERVHREHRSVFAAAAAGDVERTIGELDTHRRHAIAALEQVLRRAVDAAG